MEEKYLKLTDTLYKIIAFFPEEESLKNKIKEKALKIMENLVLISVSKDNPHPETKEKISNQTLKDIEVLKSYLKLGKLQGWIDSLNFFILTKEYDKIKENLQTEGIEREKTTKIEPLATEPIEKPEVIAKFVTSNESISERQKKIIEFLEKQGRAQVADLKKIFPEVSKRTLRRDFEDLLKKEKIVRVGEWNQIFYKLNRTEPSS